MTSIAFAIVVTDGVTLRTIHPAAKPSLTGRGRMLRVEVYINRRRIAVADAINCSDLASVSNYACAALTEASPITGAPKGTHQFAIEGHDREQSGWALVAKMAPRLAEMEASQPTPSRQESKGGERG